MTNPTNPYAGKADYCFWRRSVSNVVPFMLDPMGEATFQISPTTKVATAGSCFAQHISRRLSKSGYTYYVVENADSAMPKATADAQNYGTFSARYGNIYTARQLLQLFDRAYGTFQPSTTVWQRGDGRYVDPFRPQFDPAGFDSPEAVHAEAQLHLAAVKQLFETLDVFVFTLGLTEGWRAKADGAVFPLAPGVAGGEWDETKYEFVNFEVEDVVADMTAFVDRLVSVNANAKILLTVSPVPLVATYENRHVMVSNTYSKSVLRVAADKVARSRSNVLYFPSYEIITSNATAHRYFDDDMRSVNESGVNHVMRVFFEHLTTNGTTKSQSTNLSFSKEFAETSRVVCDEEALDA